MAFNQIRGAQIAQKSITDSHVNGKLTEAVLDIKFADHSNEILDKKLVVDYVQKDNVTVSADSNSIVVQLSSPVAPDSTSKGVVLNTYIVKTRVHGTESPLMINEVEVYGKLTNYDNTGGTNNFTLSFFTKDGTGNDVAATVPSGTVLDLVYPQRFSLADVDEMFAANERFVDGATDVTAYLNLSQLAKDVFGTYHFNNNDTTANPFGNGNNFVQQLNKVTSGNTNTTEKASDIIDEVVSGRGTKTSLNERFQTIEAAIGEGSNLDTRLDNIEGEIQVATDDKGFSNLDDRFTHAEDRITNVEKIRPELLNETDADKGAGMVHVKSDSTVATGLSLTAGSASVQSALDGLYSKIAKEITDRSDVFTGLTNTLASTLTGKGASLIGVEDAKGYFTSTTVEATLSELYDKIVTDVSAEASARQTVANNLSTLTTEVTDARGTAANLKTRLAVSLNNDGTLKDYTKFHKHQSKNVTVSSANAGTTTVDFTFGGADQFDTPKVTDDFKVYVNGMKQVKTMHYSVTIAGNIVTVTFTSGLAQDDVVELDAAIYASPQTV